MDGYGTDYGQIRLNLAPLAPLRLLRPQRLANGTCRIWVASTDGTTLEPARAAHVEVYACDSLGGTANWTRLNPGFSFLNGMLYMDDAAASAIPARFYRLRETQ